ncbi:MAG: MotA/TolQ/ExbB proton channel family protein, partial [Ignavibacteriales bacterium]|nr:MotA/TolQ/ExbB proton channel family protein [Ignavibacteriales bacterium]
MNLFSLALKGGIMMLPIFLCSVLGVYVVIERYLVLRSAQINISSFLQKVKEGFRRSGVSGVEEVCSRTLAPIANILLRGIAKHSFGETKIKEAIENAGRDEIYHLEKRLNWLAIVAGIAPMLGFLGTVTGMIAAFQQIEAQGANVVP